VHPEILLMDEWLSVGDEGFKEKAKSRMNDLVHKTNILVIATHSREQLLQTCNRAIWLEHGKILMDDDTAKVAAAYFDRKV
jgi:lipopolysaccharide transport system ATP-binding protein